MSRKKNQKPTSKSLGVLLSDRYARWLHHFNEGCSDPSWSDGVNMNLVRNHISYYKRTVEETFGENFLAYPDEYFFLLPCELPNDFMAKERIMRSEKVPANTYGLTLKDCFKFNWKEVLT